MGTFNATFSDRHAGFESSLNEEQHFRSTFGEVNKVSTSNYNELHNKPSIEGNVLTGDKTFCQLGLGEITPQEIDDLFDEMIYGRS